MVLVLLLVAHFTSFANGSSAMALLFGMQCDKNEEASLISSKGATVCDEVEGGELRCFDLRCVRGHRTSVLCLAAIVVHLSVVDYM